MSPSDGDAVMDLSCPLCLRLAVLDRCAEECREHGTTATDVCLPLSREDREYIDYRIRHPRVVVAR